MLNVIADIRQAIGDKEGRIMLWDLAGAVKAKIETLENEQVKSNDEFEAIGYIVGEYMPDPNSSKLIDSILTMEMLIETQAGHIKALDYFLDQHDLTRCILRRDILKEFPGDASTMSTADIATTVLTLFNNTQALADKLQTLLDSSRHECEGLRAQLNAGAITSTLEQVAPAGYLLRVPTREHRVITKRASAEQAAVSAVNAGAASAEVLALYPIGRASRRAQWRAA